MNATALVLPSWTADIQRYSQEAIIYTPIVWGAFKRTIAPVIIDCLRGMFHHCIERESLWRQWAMNTAGISHNPLQAAFDAAHAELTSTEARVTYRRIHYLVGEIAMVLLGFGLGFVLPFLAVINLALGGYRVAVRLFRAVNGRLNPSLSASDLLMPSVGMAIASHQEFASQPGSAAAQAAAVEDVPDFWAEPLPLFHTPPVVGVAWNPAPGRNMHEEVRRLFELQHVPLTLPAPIIEQLAPEPATELPEQAPVVDELATALDVPGAIAKPKRERKPKARLSKAAAAKPKEARASAGAKGEK
jgi:hypothetical protein